MNEPELRAALAKVIAADRSLSEDQAAEVAARYLAWRSTLPDREPKPWEERKARRYIDGVWLWEGRPSVVFAGQGKGKSNFAAFVIEKVLETRPTWDVFTNLPFPWDTDGDGPAEAAPGNRIRPVSSLSELLRGTANTVLDNRKPAVVLDEMDQAVTSHSWSTAEAQSWQRLVMIERHLRIRGPLLVYHTYRHVPVELREGTMLRSMMQVIIKDGARWVIRREEEGFLYVPAAVLPYLAYGLRGFDIDVDVQHLERHLSGSGPAVARQVLAYLDRRQGRREEAGQQEREAEQEREDRETIRCFAFRRFEEGASTRQVAEETGMSKSRAGRLHLAWVAERARLLARTR